MCDHRREREERLKAAPANEDGAVESREVNGQAAVKRLQTSFVESGVSAALLRYLSDTGPLLLQDSWDLPRSNDDAEAARQQLKAANSDAQAMADKRCDALRHACEQLGQEVERMEELHVDDQLSALSIELAALEEAEAALQQAEEAAGLATCSAQGEGSEAAQVAALTRVKAELAASLQRCAAAEGLSSHLAAAAAAAATQASEEQSHPAERHTRSAGPSPTATFSGTSSSTQQTAEQGSHAQAAVQQLAELLCPAALTAQTARSLSLRLPLPSPHSLPSPPLTREAAASGSAAARACAPATGKAGLPAVVLGGAGEGSMGEGSSATVEVAVLRGGHVAAASIGAPGLPQRSLPLQPSTHAADSATGANQQHPGGAGVPVAAAVAEAACLLRLLVLRRAHMANALATAPFPPRYMVEMAGEGAFKVKWANGATLTLTACNDWPMPGGHLAVADVELPHTAQSGEERQQLLSLLSTAVGDAQRQDDTPPAPPALSALGGVIAAAGACLRKAMMVALKTS
ncbi:unnamed protein product [Closterium sp. NIES-65]|nr:unnamed protein product [Closterium sp. NIES-65]